MVERSPTGAEYRAIRAAVGWSDVAPEVADPALRQSLYGVVLLDDDEVVGCGRIVGDGGLSFYIEDLAVVPRLQGRGFGTKIMEHLMAWLDENVPPGRAVYLMAADGSVGFYERHGFLRRLDAAPGMQRRW